MEFIIRQTVDLAHENNLMCYAQPLEYGDACAHRWVVTINEDGAKADLSAMSAKCYVTRAASDADRAKGVTSVTMILDAEIDSKTGTVSCLFDAACYGGVGAATAILRLSDAAGAKVTAAKLTARLNRNTSDAVYDPEGLVPSLDALLAQIEAMEAATAAAKTATASANTATGKANAAANNANNAASAANTAASGASGWANATMTATSLAPGSAPTATVTTASDGHKVITVGIPRGDTGATPQISVEVATGAAGSEASVSVSGTAENPVIHLTIPRGNTGTIENLTINGKPVESGTITLTASDVRARPDTWMPSASDVGARPNTWMPSASDVGALPSGGTAANASKLGGKSLADIMLMMYPVGAIYMSTVSTSPASLFGGTWKQLTDRFLLGASSAYAAGSTGGEKTHTLTTSEMPAHAGHLYGSAGSLKGKGNATGKWLKEIYDGGTSNPYGWDYGDNEYYPANRSLGGGAAHNNMPPYLAVYMWKRTG